MRPAVTYFSGREFDAHQPHFLDSCFLCQKSLSRKSDIFMYRGDTAFCSPECRQEQIDRDEAGESRRLITAAKRASNRQVPETAGESDGKRSMRTGALVVA